MVTIEDFSRLVSGIYAAALTPQNWGVALADISRILDATGCGLLTGEGPSRSPMTTTVPPEASKSYREYYRTIDYVLDAVELSVTVIGMCKTVTHVGSGRRVSRRCQCYL